MATNNKTSDQLKEITDKLKDGIKEIFNSEKYQSYLKTMTRFNQYSTRNIMLINMQMPDATQVAGFQMWKNNFGRHVKKGEKGIRILAPAPITIKKEMERLDPNTQSPIFDKDGKIVTEEVEITIPKFKVVTVFDVAQTEGKPLPQLAEDLTGNVWQYEAFIEALKLVSPLPIEFKPLEGKDGVCRYGEKISIREGMSEVQTVSAVIHEIAHAKLHDINSLDEYIKGGKTKDKSTIEIEAESISYAVCQYYGIETSANSFGYILNWSSGRELKELSASLETIRKTAANLIDDIDKKFKEINLEYDIKLPVEASVLESYAPVEDEQTADTSLPDLSTIKPVPEQPINQPKEERKNTIPHRNYRALMKIAPEMLEGKYEYMRFQAGESFMPLSFGKLYDNRFALMHYYTQNGDIMRDPDMEIVIDHEKRTVNAMTFRQDPIIHQEVKHEGSRLQKDLNSFLSQWLKNIKQQGYEAETAKFYNEVTEVTEKVFFNSDRKPFTVHMGSLGNGLTVWNNLEEVNGDYKTIAHIDADRTVKFYEDNLPPAVKEIIEEEAQALEMTVSETQDLAVITTPAKQPEPVSSGKPEQSQEKNHTNEVESDIYMPDPEIGLSDCDLYGYTDFDMLPLLADRALELFDKAHTIYMLYTDGTEAMVFEREEILSHPGIFGIESEEWESSQEFAAMVQTADNSEAAKEAALIYSNEDTFSIYQLKQSDETRDYRFEGLDAIEARGLSVERNNYTLVYTAALHSNNTLNSLYEKFNINRPADFTGHSLSVSDIIVLSQKGNITSHYVDVFGFKELPSFLGHEKSNISLQNIENEATNPTIAEPETQKKKEKQISLTGYTQILKKEKKEASSKGKPSILAQLNKSNKTALQGREFEKNTHKRKNEQEV